MFRERLRGCAAVSAAQAEALEAHYALLCRWNRVLNLTAIESEEEAVARHYCEALFLAAHIPERPGLRLADVGSGAGFPGFPLAVVRPLCRVTLIESHQRKAVFLKEASRALGNVRVLACRAEKVEESFDWVVSRAVSYRDLGPAVKRLVGRWALLTGAEEPPPEWEMGWEAIPIPGSKARFLRVSRETERSADRSQNDKPGLL